MDHQIINSISQQVYQRFPEVKGSSPKVESQESGRVLLVYSGSATAANGHSIQRIVRVVAAENGKIIKMTTSR
jgi:hypothetical protein